MNRNELVQIAKLIQIVVEREIQKNTAPLLSEIKRLNTKISKLDESNLSKKQIKSDNNSFDSILSEIKPSTQKPKKLSFLQDIFEDITPFDDDSEMTESILDLKASQSNDPASKILNKLQTTDFRKTLKIMEESANRHSNSQMHR
jgi:hypothetical protein